MTGGRGAAQELTADHADTGSTASRGPGALTRPGQAVNFRLFEGVQAPVEDVVEGRAVASLRRG